ncbi:hypothetical protein WJX81_004537 [Elliptochloris bilobata]|uniref:Carbonic anhydrase n=1 Tax=Elliptochloris bilobata TaxID=381761 RepID=A0AAW1QMX4_9CHLO
MTGPCGECGTTPCNGNHEAWTGSFAPLLAKNKQWRASMLEHDPTFFTKLANTQAPEYLWIGCADSRVPANQILDLAPGEVFVQRNVGNLATHKDLNCMACLEYSVDHLKVKHIMVVGHYNCGAVKASLAWEPKVAGLCNLWIADIRDTRNAHEDELKDLSFDDKWDRLAELNVVRQVFNVCTSPIVQAAWARGQKLAVHGLIYHPGEGLIKELTAAVHGPHKGLSPESLAESKPAAESKVARRMSEQVNEHLRVHMSFHQPPKSAAHA